jgi:hypothetical protein
VPKQAQLSRHYGCWLAIRQLLLQNKQNPKISSFKPALSKAEGTPNTRLLPLVCGLESSVFGLLNSQPSTINRIAFMAVNTTWFTVID